MKDLRRVAGVTDGQQKNRNGIRVGRGDAGESVFGARAGLHGKDADALAVGDPGEAVGDADADSFLTANDGLDARRSSGFDQRVGWIAA